MPRQTLSSTRSSKLPNLTQRLMKLKLIAKMLRFSITRKMNNQLSRKRHLLPLSPLQALSPKQTLPLLHSNSSRLLRG